MLGGQLETSVVGSPVQKSQAQSFPYLPSKDSSGSVQCGDLGWGKSHNEEVALHPYNSRPHSSGLDR